LAKAGDTVSMAGGELTFHAPAGWSREECPHPDPSCLDVRPPGDGGAGRIIVIVQPYQSNAPEGDISLMLLQPGVAPAASHFTVDGVDFVRIHDSGSASDGKPATMVLGLLPNRDTVRILCDEGDRAEVLKAGCDVVIGSLHLRT
jgi:hypothetical protein